jgi:catechol-2,3-dioxygenase
MAIKSLNHAVLYVRDAERTATFYGDVLGFREVGRVPIGPGRLGVFMQAPGSSNDHDIAFFSTGPSAAASSAGRDQVGLYHIAWEVETLADLAAYARRLTEIGSLVGSTDHGTTKALYAKDPDGIEFEVSWIVPLYLVDDLDEARATWAVLDIEADIARYGADTPGGTATVPA